MKHFYGGEFSWFDKFRLGGVGSSNVIYNGGIPLLDDAIRDVEGELLFVNFEILKNGLLLRSNINQRTMCVGVKLDEIRSIKM